jgi:hypothetical protein
MLSPSSGITVLCEPYPLPKLSSTVLGPCTCCTSPVPHAICFTSSSTDPTVPARFKWRRWGSMAQKMSPCGLIEQICKNKRGEYILRVEDLYICCRTSS